MHIGQTLLVKHEGKIQEGIVEQIHLEDLDIRLSNGDLVSRKFWEVRKIEHNNE